MKQYITYKAFGGIITVLSAPPLISLIVNAIRPNTYHTEPAINWSYVIISVIVCSIGVYIFIASDKKLKEAEKNSESTDKKKEQWMDWKSMLIAAIIFILFAIAIVFKDLF